MSLRSSAHQKNFRTEDQTVTDDILVEIRATRDAFAQAHGYDAVAMAAALRRLNDVGDWRVVRLPPRRPAKIAAETAPPKRVVTSST
jgi:hypothetical protein